MAVVELPPQQAIRIPAFARTVDGFRRWAKSPEFPDRGHICFIDGEIFIDMSPEAIETHNKVKSVTDRTLGNLVDKGDLGQFYSDRVLLTNEDAGLSTEPDGTFVSWESLETGRVKLVPHRDREGDFSELQGSPDMVLEVVSTSSVHKDTVQLKHIYFRAGVQEYWLIDARGDEIIFRVLVRRPSGFVTAPCRGGWVRSQVFGCSFRLVRRRGRMNLWHYTLQVRDK